MRAFVLVAVVALLSSAVLVVPARHAPSRLTGSLAEILAQHDALFAGADLSASAERRVYRADGTWVSETITGYDFLRDAHVGLSHLAGGLRTEAVAVPDIAAGFGVAEADAPGLAARLAWPYCDVASFYDEYVGASHSFATLVQVEPSPLGDTDARPACGGVFGPTHTYKSIAFDTTLVGRGLLVACSDAEIQPTAEVTVGRAGGYNCLGVTSGSVHGNAVLFSEWFNWCRCGLDYALGAGDAVAVGDAGFVPVPSS